MNLKEVPYFDFKKNIFLAFMMHSLSGSTNITWELSVTLFMDSAEDGVTGTIIFSLPQLSRSQKLVIKLSHGIHKISFPEMLFTEKDDIKPWWPQGYGKPNLYTVKVLNLQNNKIRCVCLMRRLTAS